MEKFRHEYKYLIDSSQLHYLINNINPVMHCDSNCVDSTYNVRSLYFDDYYHSCFYDNENGNDPREKFRIRIYNHSSNRISLECKRKENGKTLKTATLISKEQCESLINGRIIKNYYELDPLIQKLTAKMLNNRFMPSIIIEYNRRPYVCNDGNVRVTFDTDMSSSNYFDKFFEEDIPKRCFMPKGINLLEVKFDEFLPDNIYNSLQLNSLEHSTFSKFYLGKLYGLGNHIAIKDNNI